MDGFADFASTLIGAPAARERAFNDEMAGRIRNQHLSAQTQKALEDAKVAQMAARKAGQEEDARSRFADAALSTGLAETPEEARGFADLLVGGAGNFQQVVAGRGGIQEQGFQRTLGDPNAGMPARLGASSVLTKKVQLAPEGPTPQVSNFAYREGLTPGQQAQFDQYALPRTSAAAPRAPSGYEFDETGTRLRPVEGGPHDPNRPAPITPLGSRERAFIQRVVGSARNAIEDARNLMELGVGSSLGTLGVGTAPGRGVFDSVRSTLKNNVAPQEVQDYNAIAAGITRALATIETSGLVPSDTFTSNFDAIILREGDTEYTKLRKLALMRQTVETGLEPLLHRGDIPKEFLTYIQNLTGTIKEVIPFTSLDVTRLIRAQEENPNITFRDLMEQKGLGNTGAEPEAVNPQTGEVLVYRNGQWQPK